MESENMSPVAKKILTVAAVAAGYYGLARVSLELALVGAFSPASGFALVMVIALGPEVCLAIFLGSWLANLHALPGLNTVPPTMAALACAAVALGNALQTLAGARLLRSEFGGIDPLSRSNDVVRFAALTPLICLFSASVGVGALVASGLVDRELFARTWLTWWIGDVVGVLITAPLFYAWRPRDSDEFGEPLSPQRALAAASALAVLSFSVWLGFGDLFTSGTRYPLSLLPFAALGWVTLRHDIRGATAGVAVLAALVQWHTVRGLGPFALEREINESMLLASIYIVAAALMALLLRALLAERRTTLVHLEEARAALALRVSEQCQHLNTAYTQLRVKTVGGRETQRRIELYRRIVDKFPIGIAVLRIDNTHDPESWLIVEFNPAGRRLFSASGENPAGKRLLEFAPAIRGTDFLPACVEALRLNHGVDFSSMGRMLGGRFSIRVFPLGAPFVGLAFEDLKARKTAGDTLARSNAELIQFAYEASHELQAPLSKAAAYAEQLKLRLNSGLDETSRDFLARMGRSIEAMQSLIDSLLNLAQVNVHAAAPCEVDLTDVAAAVLVDFEDSIKRCGARVHCAELPIVMGDPHQLRRLLQNLIGNAIKFTVPGTAPSVRLKGRVFDDGHSELVVEDDGIGFDMKSADRVFQPFSRLHNRKDYPGNGMGLAICSKLVERHGGTISVESSIGCGTQFTVAFPSGRTNICKNAPLENALR